MINELIWNEIVELMQEEETKLHNETKQEAIRCGDQVARGERAGQGALMCAYLREVGFGMAINRMITLKSDLCTEEFNQMAKILMHQAARAPDAGRRHEGIDPDADRSVTTDPKGWG
jgi:hypothetical protein